jgi:mRNA interferase RelE/StbE
MFSIRFTKSAEKKLYKLEKTVHKRIIHALERLRFRPFDYVKKLVGSPYYRLKVGEYRSILDIRGDEFTIMVIYVGHRKKVYKNITEN